MTPTEWILILLLGLGLSASTGLNTFLPLLLLGTAAHFDIGGIALGDKFAWLGSEAALITLIIASIAEIVADKIPAVDHMLDGLGTFVRPVAGTVAAASVITDVDPMIAAVLGLIIGAPTSLGVHTLKAGTRVASSAVTFGCANPIVSVLEDIASVLMTVLAIFAPVVVPFAIALVVFVLWRAMARARRSTTPVPQ